MFDSNALKYHVFKDYNIQFDEKNNTCGTVRKVQWVKEGKEPDEDKGKIEIRHITVDETGEKALKGYAFSTPEGPDELVEGMVEVGFGRTKELLKSCRKRVDFMEAAVNINKDDDDDSDGEMFDMRDLLSGYESDEEEEED